MRKWDLARRTAQFVLVAAVAVIPFVIILAIVGAGIAGAAIHLGQQIAGTDPAAAPSPVWFDPSRIVAAIGSAIGALSGALVAIGAIEWQDWRRRSRARHIVEEALTDAYSEGRYFLDKRQQGNFAAASEHIVRMITWLNTARDVAVSQRDRSLAMARVAAELEARRAKIEEIGELTSKNLAALGSSEFLVRTMTDNIRMLVDVVNPPVD